MNQHLFLFFQSIFGRTSENYGHDKILKEYTRYPAFLPLNAHIQHGWYGAEIPDFQKIDKIPFMLAWSQRIADEWKTRTTKPVFVLGSPFIIYRHLRGIAQKPDAKGTVVFPDHSTPSTTAVHDVENYCLELEKLPEYMKPISICLHFRDVDQYGKQFQDHGFSVFTAGDSRQAGNGFVQNFYDILSRHKYSCSNVIGSFTFYSVEMGIPFFVYGPECKCVKKDDNKTVVEYGAFRQKTRDLFRTIQEEPTPEQRAFVSFEVGEPDKVSPDWLRRYFLKRFFFREIPLYLPRFFKATFDAFAKLLKKKAKRS
jgi:hypothetical protein